MDDRVAIGHARLGVIDEDRLAVEEEVLRALHVGVGRPRRGGRRRRGAGRRAHAGEHVLVRHDRAAGCRWSWRHASRAAALPPVWSGRKLVFTSQRIGAPETRADGRPAASRRAAQAAVHHEHALGPGLHRDVAAGADQHRHRALHREHLDIAARIPGGLLRLRGGARHQGDGDRQRRVSQTRGHSTHFDPAGLGARGSVRRRSWYSGYIVAAPPLAASTGTP